MRQAIGNLLEDLRQRLLPGLSSSEGAESQGTHRNRRAMLAGSAAVLARVIQIGTSLITVPVTLKYLGNERFGLWMTLSSVLAMAAFADFGVGNGVLNTVSKAYGRDDRLGIRRAISSGFAVLSVIAAVLIALFFAIYPHINWADMFRATSPQARAEAGPALIVFAVCFALNIVLDVVQRVQLGIQQGYRYGLWGMFGSVAGLVGVLVGIHMQASLPLLVVALAGAPVLATLLNAIHFFSVSQPDLRPSLQLISRDAIVQIARLGFLFFVLQMVGAFAFSADSVIIARVQGVANVPEYAIPQRMFSLISMVIAMLVTPLWPAYGEAISRGDMAWVRRTLGRSLLMVLAASALGAGCLFLLSDTLLRWWVGSSIHPPLLLLAGLAVWSILECCGNAAAMFLNGASVMKFQIITASLFGLGCVTAKVIFVQKYGIVAVPWSTIGSYALLTVLPCFLFIPKVLRTFELQSSLAILEASENPLATAQVSER